MSKTQRIILSLSYIMRFLLLAEIVFSIVSQNWLALFLSTLGFILTFTQNIIEKNYKITLPLEFEFLLIFFIFGTLYLGEGRRYYDLYWWWDIMLHTLSGIILGILGFLMVYILNQEKKIKVNLAPGFVALFTFMFAVAIGAIWEITEFLIDITFDANTQKGNTDTMTDLIVDTLGALFVSILGYFYMKKVKIPIVEYFVLKIRKKPIPKK